MAGRSHGSTVHDARTRYYTPRGVGRSSTIGGGHIGSNGGGANWVKSRGGGNWTKSDKKCIKKKHSWLAIFLHSDQ